MASTLKSIVAFTDVAGGGAAFGDNHNLNVDGVGVVPDKVELDNPDFEYVSASTTQIIVRNNGAQGSCNALCEFWYSPDRAFGSGNAGINDQLTPAPFVPSGSGGSATGGQALTYRDDGVATDIYVDQTNGSDSNDGLTPATALATLPAVRQKFPWQLMGNSRFVVNLLNTTATQLTYRDDAIRIGGGNEALFVSFAYRGPSMILFSPTTGPATAALDGTPSVDVGNRTRFDFTGAAPGWTVNDLAGSFIRITRGGVRVFNELPISENTADTIFVDTLGITGTLLATDTAEIVIPAVRLQAPTGNTSLGILTAIGQSSICPGFISALAAGTQQCTFERIAIGDAYLVGIHGLCFDRCQTDAPLGFGLRIFSGSSAFVNHALKSAVLQLGGGSDFQPQSRDVTFGSDPVDRGPRVSVTGVDDSSIQVGNAAGGFIPNFQGVVRFGAPLSNYRNSFGDGITCDGPSALIIPDSVPVQGTGNSGVGLRARRGARIRVPGGTDTTITGTGGDLAVETGAAVSYGTGVGEFEEAAGFAGNFTRVQENAGSAASPRGDTSVITTAAI